MVVPAMVTLLLPLANEMPLRPALVMVVLAMVMPMLRRAAIRMFSDQFTGSLREVYLEGIALQLFAIQSAAAADMSERRLNTGFKALFGTTMRCGSAAYPFASRDLDSDRTETKKAAQ